MSHPGSNLPAWRNALIEYIRVQARPADKFGHQARLYALTLQIGAGLTYDDDIVFAAAWLHDLGVFIGHRPEDPILLARWDSVLYAVEQSPAILSNLGFPAAKIPGTLALIRTHQPSADPAVARPYHLEATILRDADLLEQLGAAGILRTIVKVGRDTRYPIYTPAIENLRSALQHLPSRILLESTRALAAPKIEIMQSFLDAVTAEAGGNLY